MKRFWPYLLVMAAVSASASVAILKVTRGEILPALGARVRGEQATKLRAAWYFNEGGGSRIWDLSGNGNHATIAYPADFTWGADSFGSPTIVSNNTYEAGLKLPVPASFALNVPYTIEWYGQLTGESPNGGYIAAIADDGGTNGCYVLQEIFTTHSSFVNCFFGNADHQGTTDLSPGGVLGKWHHIAIVAQTNSLVFYIDGIQDATTFATTFNWTPGGLLDDHTADGSGFATGWPGRFSFLKIYSYAETPAQIFDHSRRATMFKSLAQVNPLARFAWPSAPTLTAGPGGFLASPH